MFAYQTCVHCDVWQLSSLFGRPTGIFHKHELGVLNGKYPLQWNVIPLLFRLEINRPRRIQKISDDLLLLRLESSSQVLHKNLLIVLPVVNQKKERKK